MLSTNFSNIKWKNNPKQTLLTMTRTRLDSTSLILKRIQPSYDRKLLVIGYDNLELRLTLWQELLRPFSVSDSRLASEHRWVVHTSSRAVSTLNPPRTDIRTRVLSFSSIIRSSLLGPDAFKKEGRDGFVTREEGGGGGGGEKGGWKGSEREIEKRNWL